MSSGNSQIIKQAHALAESTDRKRVFLSNGITSAIENEGRIEWFPCPKFDSPSIFSGILDDRKGGYFAIRPEGRYSVKTAYVEDTLVAENFFSTSKGSLSMHDFMPLSLPAIMRVYESRIPFIADIQPMFNYGMINPSVEYVEDGISFRNNGSNEGVEISINGEYEVLSDGTLEMQPGHGNFFLMYSKDLRYGLFSNKSFVFPDPYDSLHKTINYWRNQLRPAKKVSKYAQAYKMSILVALGLIYQPSGAIIAAPTASLPEIIGDTRNWDYRYMWIRDGAYAAEALTKIGYATETKRIFDFMFSVTDPSSKTFDHPLYSIDGTAPRPEENIGWLSGSHKSKPIRIGNGAYMQVQMDVEGAFIDALYTYLNMTNEKSYIINHWWVIEAAIEWVGRSWTFPSTSLWEERETLAHFVNTKVMQWVAVDRACRMARSIGQAQEAKDWSILADMIRHDIMLHGYSNETKSFVKSYDSQEVDAALLVMPLYGFIDAKDPKFLSTLRRIEVELLISNGLMLRYKNDALGSVQHPFTLLNTWLARVYLRMGERRMAERVIDSMLRYATDMLLFGEHVDAKTREPLGNFPQLFPHAGLLTTIAEYDDPTLYSRRED